MKILLIEDKDSDISVFKDSVDAWNIGKAEQFEVEVCTTLEGALSRLLSPNDLDGIVLDLKLPQNTNGEEVIKRLGKLYLRIPVVVLSGTPAELADEYQIVCLNSFVKAEQHEKEILDLLWDCKRSGLMKLIGGKGLFERYLKTVFDKCIVPRFGEWRELMKAVAADKAEVTASEALTRHVLTCLGLLLSNDTEKIQPEECYVLLPDEAISCPRPGMILKDSNEVHYLVLNPACDLAIRSNGSANSDVMLLVPIDSEMDTLKALMQAPANGATLSSKQKRHNAGIRENAYKNKEPIRFHWLPRCGKFEGGFVNFRNVFTCDSAKFGNEYIVCENKFIVHPDVLKNIQSRFASYYARQGQPDIDFSRFSSEAIDGYW